ncbi:MAG: hypothetical protein Q9185_006421 [Variospora sp. 1 TL-2023]
MLASFLILTFSFFPIAHADASRPVDERAASSRSLSSRVKRECSPSTENELDRPCPPPKPPLGPSVHDYTIRDQDNPKIPPVTFRITVPEALTVGTWDKNLLANLRITVPSILRQLSVEAKQIPALTLQGIPLLVQALRAVLSGQSLSDVPSRIARRDSLSAIRQWIDVRLFTRNPVCFIFSALLTPGFLFTDLSFLVLNPGNGEPITADQDYFINPLHGSWISPDDNIRLYYNSIFATVFGLADGITFGNRIYLKLDRSAINVNIPLLSDIGFRQRTRLLLHEYTHVKQYRDFNDSQTAFGFAYLKAFCQYGFSYRANPFEDEAFVKQQQVNKLLQDPLGTQFMDIWKLNNWAARIGSPTRTGYESDPARPGEYHLRFQRGSITLNYNRPLARPGYIGESLSSCTARI